MLMYNHKGTVTYTMNMFDTHIKTLEFEVLWGSPLTYSELKHKVMEQYPLQLGIAQCILSLNYETKQEIWK
jgi:hypothetical protein